jgi:hypothetical protein
VPGAEFPDRRSFVRNAVPSAASTKLTPIPIDDDPPSAPPDRAPSDPVPPDTAPTTTSTIPVDPDEQLVDAPQRVAGQPLVAQAAQRLDSLPAVAARVRQHVDLFGQQISGVGQYQQQGVGRTRRIRLELKFKVGEQLASWQQVSDGRFYWQRRDLPGLSGLSRIDLRRVRETLDAQQGSAPPALQQWMVLGGLGRLLAALDHYFTFGEAEPAMLQDLPVWIIQGEWNSAALGQIVPELAPRIAAGEAITSDNLPRHLPDSVRLVLGRDQRLPLFPYRIVYQRHRAVRPGLIGTLATKAAEVTESSTTQLAALELYEVNPAPPFRAEDFNYDPGEQSVQDETDLYLRQLLDDAQSPPLGNKPAPASAQRNSPTGNSTPPR